MQTNWIWYIVAALVGLFVIKKFGLLSPSPTTITSPVPTGYTGYGAGLPPGVNPITAQGGYGGAPITVGNPSGTSVAQDVATYAGAATNLLNGLFGQGGAFSGAFGGSSGGGGSYDDTYG